MENLCLDPLALLEFSHLHSTNMTMTNDNDLSQDAMALLALWQWLSFQCPKNYDTICD